MLMRSMRLAALTMAMMVLATACGEAKGPYVRENERILDTLPTMQDAVVMTVDSNSYCLSDSCLRPDGHVTHVVYEFPDNVTDQTVIDFYVAALSDEWRYQPEETPVIDLITGERVGTELVVLFTRGEALVSINTDIFSEVGAHTFEVAIDHRGNR